eukprot:CAMPEP_0184307230 /NCGR_PEP_ID=MMETSP1049-20130417/16035_1 /TAXON_ID=77928 /ORGANISM="Proteomonas sulcata, Strain CCMP704" /LENGTH=242 /DNA_ID=CAMNT_0026619679 /DNA_START=56 /DNA_END=784 /DNA_ORIENTATION=+
MAQPLPTVQGNRLLGSVVGGHPLKGQEAKSPPVNNSSENGKPSKFAGAHDPREVLFQADNGIRHGPEMQGAGGSTPLKGEKAKQLSAMYSAAISPFSPPGPQRISTPERWSGTSSYEQNTSGDRLDLLTSDAPSLEDLVGEGANRSMMTRTRFPVHAMQREGEAAMSLGSPAQPHPQDSGERTSGLLSPAPIASTTALNPSEVALNLSNKTPVSYSTISSSTLKRDKGGKGAQGRPGKKGEL